jgi:hypothetical protein
MKGKNMSYQNFEKALEKAQKCKYYTTISGTDDLTIKKSEKMLELEFSRQLIEFYKSYGYISFDGNEIFGIDPDDDSGILEGNSVLYALNDREEYGLSPKWVPIYTYGDGMMAYLDYSDINNSGEPRVVMAYYDGSKYIIEKVVAEDFGDFLYDLVNSCETE